MGQTEQDKICRTGVGMHIHRTHQTLQHPGSIKLDLFGLLQQHIMMLQQDFSHHLRQYPDIIRQTEFFQLLQPNLVAGQETQTQTRHTQFGKSTHHQQVCITPQIR